MKIKIWYVPIVFILVLLSIYLIRYKTDNNISHRISKETVAVINVNLRQLEHHFLIDFFHSPYKHLKEIYLKDEDRISNQYLSLIKDIELQKNILFYTKDTLFNTWVSSKFKVKNNNDFVELLTINGFELIKNKQLSIYRKNKFYVLLQASNLQVCFTDKKIESVIESYFNNTDYTLEDTEIQKHINNTKGDISFATVKNGAIDVSFNNGEINIFGNYKFNIFKTLAVLDKDNSLANLSVSFNKNNKSFKKLISNINREKFKKISKTSIDTLVEKWNGDLYFSLSDFQTKIDTILTYTYDDNFNKIEKVDIQEEIYPNFNFKIGIQIQARKYLVDSGAVLVTENDSIFTVFPLIKTYVSTTTNSINVYTIHKNTSQSKQFNKLHIDINVSEYYNQTDSTIYSYNKHFKIIKNVNAVINKDDELLVSIKMNDERNAFVYIIRNMFE